MATIFNPGEVHQRARAALLANNWWAAAIRGVCATLIGALAILAPAVTLTALVLIFAAYSFVDGVFAIVLAIRGARKHERWGWLAFNGVVSIAAATVAILFPATTVRPGSASARGMAVGGWWPAAPSPSSLASGLCLTSALEC
jgi:uncharacterized membrane protein HdeD (DUF308 family)